MARTSRPQSASQRAPRKPRAAKPQVPPQDAAIDALTALLARRRYVEIGLADIARQAGLSLADLRDAYPGKLSIIAGLSRRIDRIVLDGGAAEGETARDRLFDVLMRRFDALTPYKSAIREISRAARRDPCLATFLNRNTARSLNWMLAAADIHKSGAFGGLSRAGLVFVYGDAFRTWLDDDDADLARTMATLDKGLARGERALKFVGDVCSRFSSFARRDRPTREDEVPVTG